MNIHEIANLIRNVPDFPKPGIQFKDITTLLANGEALATVTDTFASRYKSRRVDYVLGIEARGFIFGAALAYALKTGFLVVRKPGKLPYKTKTITYSLEYGTDSLEIHEDAIKPGNDILIVDDLLATGGTVAGVSKLIKDLGANIVECAFVIELDALSGRKKLTGFDVFSLIHF